MLNNNEVNLVSIKSDDQLIEEKIKELVYGKIDKLEIKIDKYVLVNTSALAAFLNGKIMKFNLLYGISFVISNDIQNQKLILEVIR